MRSKRGFTLVELLAVIAILAILVIMALPAVLRMFNQARIDTFGNEINTILRTARQQYLLDGGNAQIWTNADGSTNELPLTGNSNLKYIVEINGNGHITNLQVTNGEYQYSKTGIVDDIENKDIKVVSELSESDKLVIDGNNSLITTYKYTVSRAEVTIGSPLPNGIEAYDNEDFYKTYGYSTFIRYALEGNTVISAYIGFVKDGKVYYLKGNDTAAYDDNKAVLLDAFTSRYCTVSANSCACNNDSVGATIFSDGFANASYGGVDCMIYDDGVFYCNIQR